MNIIKAHIPRSKWSRPETTRGATRGIVMHWAGKSQQEPPGVIAYWQGRKGTYGSAHYVIGNDGQVYEAIRAGEVAYHCGSKGYTDLAKHLFPNVGPGLSANHFTIGVEMCIADPEGSFTDECHGSTVVLVAELCDAYDLDPFTQVVTHNMVVGWKQCPRWWVQHPADFEWFRHSVAAAMQGQPSYNDPDSA